MTAEERIARLEETLFFQERLLHELNAALTGQQRQLDVMERALGELGVRVEDLRLTVEAGNSPANIPPPHYS
ncbi:Protein SlyX homolog [uncultured delta proteobacterium]|uniref:Protein SlyX homolog n=1 Tax=uncultured delta proteobacterium TaxID=34034 RepID=A0A212JV39_9DELT|nr:Protein SlyX homolog [uncultured delta proteobacterium]